MSDRPNLHAVDGAATPDEVALLTAYRTMDDVSRSEIVVIAQSFAIDAPRTRRRAALTLVHGGLPARGGER
jgi:hypothetical protein